jgi:hypothetical protein
MIHFHIWDARIVKSDDGKCHYIMHPTSDATHPTSDAVLGWADTRAEAQRAVDVINDMARVLRGTGEKVA